MFYFENLMFHQLIHNYVSLPLILLRLQCKTENYKNKLHLSHLKEWVRFS